MKKMLFIINPRSGKEQIRPRLLKILDIFVKAGYGPQVLVIQRQGHARELAEEWGREANLIVCSGGDGTLNEVISGLMHLETKPPLGYIPAGSTNDFASSLGISKNMEQAAQTVIEGTPFAVDVGRLGDRNFIYVAAFGAFTDVSYMTPQESKNLLGHQAYMLEAVKRVAQLKSYHMKVSCETEEVEGDFIFGMVTNTRSVGGFKGLINQEVELDDGEFEVLLIKMPKTPMDLNNIVSYMFFREEKNDYVHKFRARRLKVEADLPVDWVVDGEFGGTYTEVEIVNCKQAIQILCDREKEPENAEWKEQAAADEMQAEAAGRENEGKTEESAETTAQTQESNAEKIKPQAN